MSPAFTEEAGRASLDGQPRAAVPT